MSLLSSLFSAPCLFSDMDYKALITRIKNLILSDCLSDHATAIREINMLDLDKVNWIIPECCGKTLMHVATEKNNIEIVKKLLEKGASFDVTDNFNKSPFDIVASNYYKEILSTFINVRINSNSKKFITENTVLSNANAELKERLKINEKKRTAQQAELDDKTSKIQNYENHFHELKKRYKNDLKEKLSDITSRHSALQQEHYELNIKYTNLRDSLKKK